MRDSTAGARRWPSEREVADQLPIDCAPETVERILESVPFWFHTFALDSDAGIYTPGVARDHGYRLASIPRSFAGRSVLDVGAFDGFYAFLAEHRGASRVLAIDNEQYRYWVKDRWGVELEGGEGFSAIAEAIGSSVEYARMEAMEVAEIDECFDFIFCFGILHRFENPFGLLRRLVGRLAPGGRMLVETAGVSEDVGAGDDLGSSEGLIRVPWPGEVNPRDDYFYWQFSAASLRHLASFMGATFEPHLTARVAGQPRLIGHIDALAGRPSTRRGSDPSRA